MMQLKLIEYGSEEYNQAALLRYRLFYLEHHIPFESIFAPQEQQDIHVAIAINSTHSVIAYGRLGQNSLHEFQIYQMVVEPDYQGQGMGKRILEALLEVAIASGAERVILHARVEKIQFYQKSGFVPIGEIFPSPTTNVPHQKMQMDV
jgi:predicted GNAT family N-acyltransferase